VVIGAGPNGLVAANVLADAGWAVLVAEAGDVPGGAVQTAELTVSGFRNDMFSAFYPLAVVSPDLARLDLAAYGLRWRHAPTVLAHPTFGGPAVVLSRQVETTAAALERFDPSAGEAWSRLHSSWCTHGRRLLDGLLGGFPPVVAGARLAAGLGPRRWLEFARFATLPVRRLVEEAGLGEGGAMLLAGNALHSDLAPEAPLSGLFGWILASLGQQVGFPVPEGGAGVLTDALVARLRSRGGVVVCGAPVERVVVQGGRAVGVVVGGSLLRARRAVVAACDAGVLFGRLVASEALPSWYRERLGRFQRGNGTVKVDWALGGPIPWADTDVRGAGTVHLGGSLDDMSTAANQLAQGLVPGRPLVVLGQMTTADPSRSPAGTESAWAYVHVPGRVRGDVAGDISGRWDDHDRAALVERLEDRIDEHAPGFRDLILARHVLTPAAMETTDPSLVGGDMGGGTGQLHQQLLFRPVPGVARWATPVERLYLGSASAHPGGGVHGACGANAARAALRHDRWRRRLHPLRAGR
jgi:phytoene dehydrogenase-like protein